MFLEIKEHVLQPLNYMKKGAPNETREKQKNKTSKESEELFPDNSLKMTGACVESYRITII